MTTHLFKYLLHHADNALILGQRNSEWTGHGPVLEQDIAITNIALDLLGQARNFYQYASDLYNGLPAAQKKDHDPWLPAPWKSFQRELTEDDLAFLRTERQYLNLLMAELPKGDWATTVLRQFFMSAFQFLLYSGLQNHEDQRLSAIAEKSLKEVAYHQRWSAEWVIRLGDGTTASHERMVKAVDQLWAYTGELFQAADYEIAATGPDPLLLKENWWKKMEAVFREATLELPAKTWMQEGGKQGRHTEHLGYLLTEMQYLQRTYPNSNW